MIKKGVIIHYLAHQIFANKNSRSKMNHQLWKMETPHNQTLHNKTTQKNTNTRTKVNSKKFKENFKQ